jgi:hypothetical protein
MGMGVGVGLRRKGFEDEEVVVWAEAEEVLLSQDPLLSVLDWRDLRRKGSEGIR